MKLRFAPVVVAPVFAAHMALAADPGASGTPPTRVSSVVPAPEVTQVRLDNGLRVVLEERHHAPFVSMVLRYGGGSREDPPGKGGLAALTQRLMTMATKHVAEGKYERWLDRVGATDRACVTGVDGSIASVTVPSNAVPLVLWLWSDQMGFFAPRVDRGLLDGARETMKNERRQKLDNAAYGAVRELAVQALYPPGHPYHALPLSLALDDVTVEDVRDFHARHFGPEGAVLVLSGDFRSADALEAITRYFGPIPSGPKESAAHLPVALDGEVRLEVAASVPSPVVQVNWRTPAFYDAGDAELDLAARILAGSRVAFLYWELVDRTKVATSVTAGQSSRALGSDFQIRATLAPGHTPDEVLRQIDEVLANFQVKVVSDATLRAAVDGVTVPRLFELDRGTQRARLLAGYALLRNDAAWLQNDLARYEAATARDVGAAIARWLTPDHRVVTVVTPDPAAPPCGVLRTTQGGR